MPLFFFLACTLSCANPIADYRGAGFASFAIEPHDALVFPGGRFPDAYDDAVREVIDLYSRILILLRSVDSPRKYRAIEESIGSIWREIATLNSRHADLDEGILNDLLSTNGDYRLLKSEFAQECRRIRRDIPDADSSLDHLIGPDAPVSDREQEVDELMRLYEEIVGTLETIRTVEDGENVHAHLRNLALRVKEMKANEAIEGELQEMLKNDPRAPALSNRLDSVFARIASDPGMERVFDALEPLAGEYSPRTKPTAEEEIALREYAVVVEKAVDLLRQIRTTNDVERLASELLELKRMDEEFDKRLPGQQGEILVESDPQLVRLMQKLGTEQMRIDGNPDLKGAIDRLFGREEDEDESEGRSAD